MPDGDGVSTTPWYVSFFGQEYFEYFDQRTGRNAVRVTLFYPDGRRAELSHDARIYTLTELAGMIARSALELQATYGGLDGSPLTLDSRRLVVVAQKPAPPDDGSLMPHSMGPG
jgi:hypothetical protein